MDKKSFELIEIASAIQKYEGKIPPVWMHGNTDWVYNEFIGVYTNRFFNEPPKQFCLGDRYAYFATQGGGTFPLRGSTSENWHGYNFNHDLKETIEWVKKANYQDLKWYLWSGIK